MKVGNNPLLQSANWLSTAELYRLANVPPSFLQTLRSRGIIAPDAVTGRILLWRSDKVDLLKTAISNALDERRKKTLGHRPDARVRFP